MTTAREWDWPEEPRRRPRIEVLPPEPDEVRITVTHRRDNSAQRWVIAAAVFVLALILLRSPIVLILLAGMAIENFAAVAFVAIIIVVAAWRQHRAGRPF
jgi:hypothetical protein